MLGAGTAAPQVPKVPKTLWNVLLGETHLPYYGYRPSHTRMLNP